MNIEYLNAEWYQTRVSPTAIMLLYYKNNIYSILIKNNNSSRWYIFPNWKIEDTDLSSKEAALREFFEEVWEFNTDENIDINYLWSLWSLYRKSWTTAINKKEVELLNFRDKDQKFLFLKKQEYHLFSANLNQEPSIIPSKDIWIEDRKIIKIIWDSKIDFNERWLNVVEIWSDLLILTAITELLYQKIDNIFITKKDIDTLNTKIDLFRDTLFS